MKHQYCTTIIGRRASVSLSIDAIDEANNAGKLAGIAAGTHLPFGGRDVHKGYSDRCETEISVIINS